MASAIEMRQGAQRSFEYVQSGASGLAKLLWAFSWLGNVSNLEAHERLPDALAKMQVQKHLARHKTRARRTLGRLARSFKHAFVHWELGCIPTTG